MIGVPASLTEGILIQGPDEEADLRRVRFVMLHEYGHLAAKQYLHPQGEQLWSSVRWFEEMMATCFAYAFVYQADPDWAGVARREWAAYVQRNPPSSATLDWQFMTRLPPQQVGQVYAWYQILLNLRAADLYAEHGLGFLRDVRDQLPWVTADQWTTEQLLTNVESFAPGFHGWAERLEGGPSVGFRAVPAPVRPRLNLVCCRRHRPAAEAPVARPLRRASRVGAPWPSEPFVRA